MSTTTGGGYITGSMISSGQSFTLAPDLGGRPASPPKGLIATQAVQTMGGWLGQVFVDKAIVFQTEPQEDSEAAIRLANERVTDVISALFTAQR